MSIADATPLWPVEVTAHGHLTRFSGALDVVLDPAADDLAHHRPVVLVRHAGRTADTRQVMLAGISDSRSRDGRVEKIFNLADPPGPDIERIRKAGAQQHRQQGYDGGEDS